MKAFVEASRLRREKRDKQYAGCALQRRPSRVDVTQGDRSVGWRAEDGNAWMKVEVIEEEEELRRQGNQETLNKDIRGELASLSGARTTWLTRWSSR